MLRDSSWETSLHIALQGIGQCSEPWLAQKAVITATEWMVVTLRIKTTLALSAARRCCSARSLRPRRAHYAFTVHAHASLLAVRTSQQVVQSVHKRTHRGAYCDAAGDGRCPHSRQHRRRQPHSLHSSGTPLRPAKVQRRGQLQCLSCRLQHR